MAYVGLRKLVYAKLLTDPLGGTPTYEEPKPFAKAITANVETATNSATNYADNRPVKVVTQIGETTLTLTSDELSQEVLSDVLGMELKKGVVIYKQTAKAPYVALGFIGDKDDDTEQVVWLTKGKFSVPSTNINTKTDSPEFQNPEITGTFIGRDADEVFKIVGDTADEAFAPFRDTFFNQVFDPAALDAPTV
ncbi:major tail protein [Metabacillus sp. 22489]|uniref:major tail protein n=1 Tax=Metabacillus sp. 22489 TaxID=3453928 RepID=UPI003F877E45